MSRRSRKPSKLEKLPAIPEEPIFSAVTSNNQEAAKRLVAEGQRLESNTIKYFEHCYTQKGMIFFCELLRLELGMPELNLSEALIVALFELKGETRFDFFRRNAGYFLLLLGNASEIRQLGDGSSILTFSLKISNAMLRKL